MNPVSKLSLHQGRPSSLKRRLAAAVLTGLLSVAPAAAASGYRIGAGDMLAVAVFNQKALSGQFKVGPEGTIDFPLAGRISVAGMTSAAIAEKLRSALAGRIPSGSEPSVEVVEYAPVFVVGDVEKPGQYQFRPGMIALELVALGGGGRRTEAAAAANPTLQIIAAEEQLYDLRLQRFNQETIRARLTAEATGSAFAPATPDAGPSIDALAAERVVENEKTIFRLRKSIFEGRNTALDAQVASFREEIEALTAGIAMQKQEVDSLQQETDIAEGLTERGVTAKTRLLALQREVSAMKRNSLELGSFLARAQQRVLEVQYQKAELKHTRESEIAEAMRTLDLESAATAKKISSLQRTLGELGVERPETPRDSGSIALSVVRQDGAEHREIPIAELTEIQPRDILRVRRVFTGPTDEASADRPGAG
jgi:polysaccharide export outer membrane protein